ncbi:uncharacterized protein FIBRA_05599 [Fibroporia radiculosa]|uniref:ER transporter 6TM N-terminal domain-containing protein n=1 Tax=Fibroporia radiculosa TaxID=599839 RepID=J4IAT4_9APHY|nr:uncharacterized protein FIBRA_05599 [Fibroporia radiculosa]CCM03466.1 predicted protein [Fibroporia radiculosa]
MNAAPLQSTTHFWDKLPPWVSSNLRARKSWRMLLRCWFASWVSFVIMLPDASLRTLGNTAFFALLGSMLVPPNMPVQVFLFVLMTVVVGVCFGWGISAAAMRAALAVRNQLLVEQTLLREEQSASGLANPDVLFETGIFNGDFLDTRSSVMFGAFLAVASFIFALIRAYMPRLLIMSIFGTIAVDIFCSYGPLFPFGEYTLLNSMLTSLACYIGIAVIVIIVIFPETLNHALLTSVSGLLSQIETLVRLQDDVLSSPVGSLIEDGAVLQRVTSTREGIIATLRAFIPQLTFINLEFSWGKWNGDDLKALEEPLSVVVSRLSSLQCVTRLIGQSLHISDCRASTSDTTPTQSQHTETGDAPVLRELYARQAGEVPFEDVLSSLRDATRPVREACAHTVVACAAVIESINTRRYSRDSTVHMDTRLEALDVAQEELERSLKAFKNTDRFVILEPFGAILDLAGNPASDEGETKKRKGAAPLRALYIAYTFAVNVVVVSQGVNALAEVIGETARKRRRNRLWAPKGLRTIWNVLSQKDGSTEEAVGEDPVRPEEEGEEYKEEKDYRRDPDGRPPRNAIQHIFNVLHRAFLWAQTPEALFAFKYVFVTIALWVPSVCRTSTHFVYAEKSIWALIMAQTTLNIYAGDQIWNIMLRLAGTFVGLVFGLLSWYIGSGNGHGSPYGMAVIVGVFLIPVLFLRIFAPPQLLPGVMMIGATWALIVGYSWIDSHLLIFGNVGFGWPVAWRRWVLVVIGAVASFIMMILPPRSARKSVRLRCASTTASLAHIYSRLMTGWIHEAASGDGDKEGLGFAGDLDWARGVREQIIGVAQKIQALKMQTTLAKFEGNLRGAWPYKEYSRLVSLEAEMLANLAMVGGSLAQLDHQVRISLLRHTKVLNPNFISDVMSTFLLVSQSLRTGEPLHQTQHQDLVDRVFYHGDMSRPINDPGADGGATARSPHLEIVTSYEYMFYASGVAAVFLLLHNLTEARTITADLCGEVSLVSCAAVEYPSPDYLVYQNAAIYNFVAILFAAGVFVHARVAPAYARLGEIVSVLSVVLVALQLKWFKAQL